jgi:hypothetical protein
LTQLYRQSWARCFTQIQNHTIKQGSTDDFRLKCLVVIAFAIIFFCGCSKYNYPNIFPFDNAFYKRAEKIDEINGYEAFMSNIEFEKMKVAFRKQGFVDWKDIGDACFYSNGKAVNISSLGKSHGGVFSINYSSLFLFSFIISLNLR